MAGNSAVAPPNRTANKSSEIAPRITGLERTKRKPSKTLCQVTGSRLVGCGPVSAHAISAIDKTSIATTTQYTTVGP